MFFKRSVKEEYMPRKSISLLFGAGAEISYGLPSGGKFALEIFRYRDSSDKDKFKEKLKRINMRSFYSTNWLPKNFKNKGVSSFRKDRYISILQSSIEYKRNAIIDFLENFDNNISEFVGMYDIDSAFYNLTENHIGDVIYSQVLEFAQPLAGGNKLFESRYFSAMLNLLEKVDPDLRDNVHFENIKTIIRTFIEFVIGACGKEFIQNLNEELFKKKPDEIDIFDDIGNVFSLEYHKIGLDGLKFLLETKPCDITEESSDLEIIEFFSYSILEKMISELIDYQALIDENFRYIYCPKANWGKFCSMAIFLQNVHDYMSSVVGNVQDFEHANGFYNDFEVLNDLFDIKAIGTTNYTNLVKRNSPTDVYYLNGSLEELYDPFLNKIIQQNVEIESDHILFPFIFTQSGIKPLTTINVSKRYVNYFDKLKESDIICVIGFGFNQDDGHINGIFRDLITEHQKEVIIFEYCTSPSFNKEKAVSKYRRKLRLENNEDIIVLPIDKEKKVYGKIWYEYITSEILQLERE